MPKNYFCSLDYLIAQTCVITRKEEFIEDDDELLKIAEEHISHLPSLSFKPYSFIPKHVEQFIQRNNEERKSIKRRMKNRR